jgi:hypothetical protein
MALHSMSVLNDCNYLFVLIIFLRHNSCYELYNNLCTVETLNLFFEILHGIL